MQGVAAALERAAMRHDRVELRQFRLQMLIGIARIIAASAARARHVASGQVRLIENRR
jgi:hypothetical protein